MPNRFQHLLRPVTIGKLSLKNRVAMAPMGLGGLLKDDGSPGPRAHDYYLERARGGVGLIITGLFKVENRIEELSLPIYQITPRAKISFAELAEALHAFGAKIFVQLTAGLGRVAGAHRIFAPPVSASANPYYWNPKVICRELATGEVEELVECFGKAAKVLAAAGVDGVELHGHEGYLFDQFATAIWNRREDKYGGDLAGRLTFALEVLRQIKAAAGQDFVVQYRFGLKHYIKGLNSGALPGEAYTEAGRDIKEGLEMARLLEQAGFDALHVDAGCYDSWYWPHPPTYQADGCMVDMAARVKQTAKVPVTAVGKLQDPFLAEEVLARGQADLVALGRALLADPFWVRRLEEDRPEKIRPCTNCLDGCLGRVFQGRPLSCAVNPRNGREASYALNKAGQAKTVLIAGGGVAGMEVARVAALRGHRVILFEKSPRLGGCLIPASVPTFKKDLGALLRWYVREMKELGVEVRLGSELTPEKAAQERPEICLVAAGARPLIPDLPGMKNPRVVPAPEVLLGLHQPGERVVVVGGGLVGCETAVWLAQQGKKVTLVEMLGELLAAGIPVPHSAKRMLLDLLVYHKVSVLTDRRLTAVADEGVILKNQDGAQERVAADTVVLALGFLPDHQLYQKLRDANYPVYEIGDARQARNVMGAIWDAYEVGRFI